MMFSRDFISKRLEPDLSTEFETKDACLESIAVSLKRIADALCEPDVYGLTGSAAISQAIKDGMREGR